MASFRTKKNWYFLKRNALFCVVVISKMQHNIHIGNKKFIFSHIFRQQQERKFYLNCIFYMYIFCITLATLIWQFVSKIGHFDWCWKLHGHLPKWQWQLIKKAKFFRFLTNIISVFELTFGQTEKISTWKVKSPPQAWNLSTLTSQHEKYHFISAKFSVT